MLHEITIGSDPVTAVSFKVFDELKGRDENLFKGTKQVGRTKPYPIVVKRISADEYPDYEKRILREVEGMNVHRVINNVIKFEGLIPNNNNDGLYYVAYEDYECSFREVDPFNINTRLCDLLRDAVTGLHHIHEKKMTHRDIHPDNILVCSLDGKRVAKISNLALSKEFQPGMLVQSVSSGFSGSLKQNGFVAPELFAIKELAPDGVDTAVDILSMGVVFFYMITNGELLFFKRDGSEMQDNIANKNFVPNYDAIKHSSIIPNYQKELFELLIKNMVTRDPKRRPTANDVKHFPCFWDFDKIDKLFVSTQGFFDAYTCNASAFSDPSLYKWNDCIDEPIKKAILLKSKSGNDVKRGIFNLFFCIRNLISHLREPENSKELRAFLKQKGYHEVESPNGPRWSIASYFLDKFPSLLFYTYEKMNNYRGMDTLQEFYNGHDFFK